jgi:A/G-specific adenine glycosylase
VVMRLLALQGVADTKQDPKINGYLTKIFPNKGAGDFNQALMELGALVCRSREPLCILCPVSKYCFAYKAGRQEIIPETKKKIVKDIKAVIAIIKKGDRYFIQKRPSRGLLADLWEFPGGKVKTGESKKTALARELNEELGVDVEVSKHLFDLKHFYTQFRVNLSVFLCTIVKDPLVDEMHKWVSYKDFLKYPMPSGSAKVIERLKFFLDKQKI